VTLTAYLEYDDDDDDDDDDGKESASYSVYYMLQHKNKTVHFVHAVYL
jgi:hypothetical protein